MDSLEEIGALLGFIAFAGLAVLVFLTFQQARHIRRLRDWAGRAPERAAAEAEEQAVAATAAAERAAAPAATTATPASGAGAPVTGEQAPLTDEGAAVDERERARERLSFDPPTDEGAYGPEPSRWDHIREEFAVRWDEWDRRSPVDPKLIVAGFLAVIVGLGIATGGFGLLGGGEETGAGTKAEKSNNGGGGGNGGGDNQSSSSDATVAVLNGTAPPGGTGVAGVADQFSADVEDAGFEVELTDDAGSFTSSVVMWQGEGEEAATELAGALESMIGETEVLEMSAEIEAIAGDADVALVIGQDDSGV